MNSTTSCPAKTNVSSKKPPVFQESITDIHSDQIRHSLQKLVNGLQDEGTIIAIQNAELSKDGTRAWITIACNASAEDKLTLVDELNDHAGFFRHELASLLQTKHTPVLTFKADMSRESQEAIEELPAIANPLPEEQAEEILNQTSSMHAVNRHSKESLLKQTNQTTPDSISLQKNTVKSHKSSSNKLPQH